MQASSHSARSVHAAALRVSATLGLLISIDAPGPIAVPTLFHRLPAKLNGLSVLAGVCMDNRELFETRVSLKLSAGIEHDATSV